MLHASTTQNKELLLEIWGSWRSWRSFPAWMATPRPSQASHLQLSPEGSKTSVAKARPGMLCQWKPYSTSSQHKREHQQRISRRYSASLEFWKQFKMFKMFKAHVTSREKRGSWGTTVAGLARNWQLAIHARVELLQSDLSPLQSQGNHVSRTCQASCSAVPAVK